MYDKRHSLYLCHFPISVANARSEDVQAAFRKQASKSASSRRAKEYLEMKIQHHDCMSNHPALSHAVSPLYDITFTLG